MAIDLENGPRRGGDQYKRITYAGSEGAHTTPRKDFYKRADNLMGAGLFFFLFFFFFFNFFLFLRRACARERFFFYSFVRVAVVILRARVRNLTEIPFSRFSHSLRAPHEMRNIIKFVSVVRTTTAATKPYNNS